MTYENVNKYYVGVKSKKRTSTIINYNKISVYNNNHIHDNNQ